MTTFSDSSISLLKNPFQKECVENIFFFMIRGNYSAKVQFKNGNTHGEQQFDGKSFDDLAKQVDAFIKTLQP